ncbi:hypothetical protein ACFY36_01990 [Actinoplanes sp. NPDC000266]
MSSLSKTELDALVAEAVVDCYDEHEQLSGLFAMIEGDLAVPFETEVFGVPVVGGVVAGADHVVEFRQQLQVGRRPVPV